MRVAHILNCAAVGGTEMMLYKLIKNSPQVEHCVFTLLESGRVGDMIEQLGVPVRPMHVLKRGIPRFGALKGLTTSLRDWRPDVIQTWAYHADLAGLYGAWKLGVPIVWSIRHGTLDKRIDSKKSLLSAKICAWFSRVPHKIVFNSRAARLVNARFGYDTSRMLHIPNGFELDVFKPSSERRTKLREQLRLNPTDRLVGMCGRFHPHKGQQDFVSAMKRVADSCPNTHFAMVGRDVDKNNEQLTSLVGATGVPGRFHLLGQYQHTNEFYPALDVFVLPSITEAMPNVVGEAMACGVPCVVTDVGDAGHLVGGSGEVVAVGDTDDIAKATARFLSMPADALEEKGRVARTRIASEFEISDIANRFVTVWNDAMQCKQVPVGTRQKPKLMHVTTVPITPYNFLRGQNKFMQESGLQVHCVCSKETRLFDLIDRGSVVGHGVDISRRFQPWKDVRSLWQLYRLFRRERPDIVQVSTAKAAVLGAIAAWAARVPHRIFQMRGLFSEGKTGLKRLLASKVDSVPPMFCSAVTANSHSMLRRAEESKLLRQNRGQVLGNGTSNGVDINRFDRKQVEPASVASIDQDSIVFGFVGRLTIDKGIHELESAWRKVRDEVSHAHLLLVGPWEAGNSVDEGVRSRLENDARVSCVGSQDEVERYYRLMDVFVFPSHREGFPNAPLEAASMTLPVIATRISGSDEAVEDGATGLIVEPKDSEALAESMMRMADDESLRNQFGIAARERVQRLFAPQIVWQAYHQLYLDLLDLDQGGREKSIERVESIRTRRAA